MTSVLLLLHACMGLRRAVKELFSNALKECEEMVFHTADTAHGNLSNNTHPCAPSFVHTHRNTLQRQMDPY